jgi:hypothetical protein
VPLTTIAKECGTGVAMIEKHYGGVIEDWDGSRSRPSGRSMPPREGLRQQRTE